MAELIHRELSEQGLVEKPHEPAIVIKLHKRGHHVEQQKRPARVGKIGVDCCIQL